MFFLEIKVFLINRVLYALVEVLHRFHIAWVLFHPVVTNDLISFNYLGFVDSTKDWIISEARNLE